RAVALRLDPEGSEGDADDLVLCERRHGEGGDEQQRGSAGSRAHEHLCSSVTAAGCRGSTGAGAIGQKITRPGEENHLPGGWRAVSGGGADRPAERSAGQKEGPLT